jgi:TatD DNase family protein
MYIDTHCHLNLQEFDQDRAMVIGNAKKANVQRIIVPGVDGYSSQKAIELTVRYPEILSASVGFHPYEAQHKPDVDALGKLLTHNVVAIGECGLDYHIYKGEQAQGKKDNQKRIFAQHLELAAAHNLPVIMHCRDAYEDFFDVIDSMSEKIRGVIHCFSGGLQEIRMAQARHLFVGIDGNLTYSKQLQAITTAIPLAMILLETDSPYLTPIPFRGDRNEPKHIPLIAKTLNELTQIPLAEIAEITTQNAHSLFGLNIV